VRDELLPGTLDMLILKAISLAPMHGYAIAQHLRQVSQEVLQIEEGSLYPALQRVMAKGWAKAEWRETPTKRRARYYTITAAGRRRLGDEVASFQRMQLAIQRVLRTQE
jgi:PadR family transcriptional regulator